MTVQVHLPPGNSGFNMQDGTNYKGRPGGHVTVSDEHAAAIRRQVGGDAGLVGSRLVPRCSLATKDGRWCPGAFPRQLGSSNTCKTCDKADTETIPESEMPEQPRAQFASGCIPVAL